MARLRSHSVIILILVASSFRLTLLAIPLHLLFESVHLGLLLLGMSGALKVALG